MKSKPTHTPTPWVVSNSTQRRIWIGGADDAVAAKAGFFQEVADVHDHHKRGKANAELIVRAVNEYEKNRETIKELKQVIQHYLFLQCRKNGDSSWQTANEWAQQAIAKAEEGPTGATYVPVL